MLRAGHEQRAKDAQAEIVKGNQIIEKLSVGALFLPRCCTHNCVILYFLIHDTEIQSARLKGSG